MSVLARLLPTSRQLLVLDAALLAWTVVWIVVGLNVAQAVRGLSDLSDTVTDVGVAVQESGRALEELRGLPIVGEQVAKPAQSVRDAGASAVESGRSSRDSVEELSVLLGLAIALIPSIPLIALYVPIRMIRAREARALRRFAALGSGDPEFELFLLRRAEEGLSYRALRRLSERPWRERDEAKLRGAELARLGVRRPDRVRANG